MNFLIQRTIGFLISVIPFSGHRTYITSILGAAAGVFLVFTGQVEVGSALFLLSIQAFFQRAGTEAQEQAQVRRLEQIEGELKAVVPNIASGVVETLEKNKAGVVK